MPISKRQSLAEARAVQSNIDFKQNGGDFVDRYSLNQLAVALSCLNDGEHNVICMKFGICRPRLTHKQIAAELDVKATKVNALWTAGIQHLRWLVDRPDKWQNLNWIARGQLRKAGVNYVRPITYDEAMLALSGSRWDGA